MNVFASTLKKIHRSLPKHKSYQLASCFNLANIPKLDPDALFDLKKRFQQDRRDSKIDLGIGAYRDLKGNSWVLPSVARLELAVQRDPSYNHEYLPITGLPELTSLLARLILGDESVLIQENRLVSVQSLSGTGALHLSLKFISNFIRDSEGNKPTVYVSGPTWGNHLKIFQVQGLQCLKYPYWNNAKKSLDMTGMIAAIENAPSGSVFLLHTCAHNPTGMDPTHEQWYEIMDAIVRKEHFPIFDSAYQGFTSGSLEVDSWIVRTVGDMKPGIPFLVCQSFLKNFGMYGERVGCLHLALLETNDALNTAVHSQFQRMIRTEISNPPLYGAKIVSKILNTPDLKNQWEQDLFEMSSRIFKMRKLLKEALTDLQTPGSWNHIVEQQGMFSFTGLSPEQVSRLEHVHGVYMASSGRISMAGVNEDNVSRIAEAINEVCTHYRY